MRRMSHLPRDEPVAGTFYGILPNGDGTADVYLAPEVTRYDAGYGAEYDIRVRVVRGVVMWNGMEEDIRARYDAWCDTAEVIDL